MAMPALKIAPEIPVEERIARIEAHTEHMQSDMSEIKSDLRGIRVEVREMDNRLNGQIDEVDKRLGGKIDEVDKRLSGKIDEVDKRLGGKIDEVDKRLGGKIDEVDKRLGAKIDGVKDALAGFQLETERRFAIIERKLADNTRWIIGVGLTVTIAVLGGMAGGFVWLAERIGTL
jgi:chromosome segregation ATPase